MPSLRIVALAALLAMPTAFKAAEAPVFSRAATLSLMQRAADWQLANPSKHALTDWTQGALYAGMMALGDISADPRYRRAMMDVGRANRWMPGDMAYHADDHCVGQMYSEMYAHYRDPAMIAPLRERFDFILANPSRGKVEDIIKTEGIPAGIMRWWWCDALFMGPPAWARLYAATGETKYLDFMIKEWWATSDYLFDKDEHLYYRDNSYFAKKETNGRNVFWSRGNGWVMGGLVRVLQILPSDHPARAKLVEQFKEMADALIVCQRADGLWRSSLLDPDNYPNPETSGSGFFCYAMAWGVNQGLLDRARFEPAVRKAWVGLTACLEADGKLTRVQPIGADPKAFDPTLSEVYGVGAFLLAGSEVYRAQLKAEVPNAALSVTNGTELFRTQETVEIPLADLRAKLPQVTADNVAVMEAGAARWITSQVLEGSAGGASPKLLFQADFLPGQEKSFTIFAGIDRARLPAPALTATARFVPERADDFAWENDRMAFRLYGPALWKQDGPARTGSGIDVWGKHVREPIVDEMYKAGDYHRDNGRSVDGYQVGTSRGCGGLAVWAQDRMWSSRCFDRWALVAAGPIRAVFELAYDGWSAAGRMVSEAKRVSLDLGSHLNRMESVFQAEGSDPLRIAAGLAVHKGGALTGGEGWATVWEPADGQDNGMLGLGLVVPGGILKKAEDHGLLLASVKPGRPFVYYAGAGWSKGPDLRGPEDWNAYVKESAVRLRAPLKVEIPESAGSRKQVP